MLSLDHSVEQKSVQTFNQREKLVQTSEIQLVPKSGQTLDTRLATKKAQVLYLWEHHLVPSLVKS